MEDVEDTTEQAVEDQDDADQDATKHNRNEISELS